MRAHPSKRDDAPTRGARHNLCPCRLPVAIVGLLGVLAFHFLAPRTAGAGEDPGERPGSPAAEDEFPLEGELKRQYEQDLAGYTKELRSAREPGAVNAVMARLAALPGRAGRDSVIRFSRLAKDPSLLNLTLNLLVKRADSVSLRFVCGLDGLRSHAVDVPGWAYQAMRVAHNATLIPYLLEVMADKKARPVALGLAAKLAAEQAPKDPKVIQATFRLARDTRFETRYLAVEALGYVATPEAVELLLDAAKRDPHQYVRGSAYTALATAKRFDLLPQLRTLLEAEGNYYARKEGQDAVKVLEGAELEAQPGKSR